MKLMTKALEKTISKYPLYSQDGKGKDAMVVAKFFLPGHGYTWYVTEAEKRIDGDYEFFGYVDGQYGEFGYFTLSQLAELRGKWGIRVERDKYFTPCTLNEILEVSA